MSKFKLTDEQRKLLDDTVLDQITRSAASADPTRANVASLSIHVERHIGSQLPARPVDFFRYVDSSLQRLRKTGRIKPQRRNSLIFWAPT